MAVQIFPSDSNLHLCTTAFWKCHGVYYYYYSFSLSCLAKQEPLWCQRSFSSSMICWDPCPSHTLLHIFLIKMSHRGSSFIMYGGWTFFMRVLLTHLEVYSYYDGLDRHSVQTLWVNSTHVAASQDQYTTIIALFLSILPFKIIRCYWLLDTIWYLKLLFFLFPYFIQYSHWIIIF